MKQCRLHLVLCMLLMIGFFCSKAQTYVPGQFYPTNQALWSSLPHYNQSTSSIHPNPHWFFSKYMGLSAGTTFGPSRYATFLSAPMGVQLNRQLNSNLYAFMGVYAAPTIVSYHGSPMYPPFSKTFPPTQSNPYSFGINPGIQMGLMHVNDAGTFSISGSISVQRDSYPWYPPAPNNSKKH